MDTGSDYFKWDGVAEKIVRERNVNTDMLLILTVRELKNFGRFWAHIVLVQNLGDQGPQKSEHADIVLPPNSPFEMASTLSALRAVMSK